MVPPQQLFFLAVLTSTFCIFCSWTTSHSISDSVEINDWGLPTRADNDRALLQDNQYYDMDKLPDDMKQAATALGYELLDGDGKPPSEDDKDRERSTKEEPRAIEAVGYSDHIEKPNFNINATPSCGVYYFYHVGKTGGSSLKTWMAKFAQKQDKDDGMYRWNTTDPNRIAFVQFGEIAKNRDFTRHKWKETLATIQEFIDLGILSQERGTQQDAPSWLAVHHHHRSPGLRYMIPLLRQWRQELHWQGCRLILATVLREPQARLQSLVSYLRIRQNKVNEFLKSQIDKQGSYLLYNSCEPTNSSSPPAWCDAPDKVAGRALQPQEIQEVVEYLKNDFDILMATDQLDGFVKESLALTGWKMTNKTQEKAPHKNKSVKRFNFTEEMIRNVKEAVRSDSVIFEKLFGQTPVALPSKVVNASMGNFNLTEFNAAEMPTRQINFIPTTKQIKPVPVLVISSLRPEYLDQVLNAILPENQNPNTPEWILRSKWYVFAHKNNYTDVENRWNQTQTLAKHYGCDLHVFEELLGSQQDYFGPKNPIRAYLAKIAWYRMMDHLFHTLNETEVLILEDDARLAHDGLLMASALFQEMWNRQDIHHIALGGGGGKNKVNADPNLIMAMRPNSFTAMAYSLNVTIFDQIHHKFQQHQASLKNKPQGLIDLQENRVDNADWTMEISRRNFIPDVIQLVPSVGRMHHIGIHGMGNDGNGTRRRQPYRIPWEFCNSTISNSTRTLGDIRLAFPLQIADQFGYFCNASTIWTGRPGQSSCTKMGFPKPLDPFGPNRINAQAVERQTARDKWAQARKDKKLKENKKLKSVLSTLAQRQTNGTEVNKQQ